MRIHTYFSNVPGNNVENQTKLLLLWKQNWEDHGYETCVLNEYIASQHPLYAPFEQRIRELPTVNPLEYELSCYRRYLAMLQVGGGLMSDWDVFTYDRNSRFFGRATDKPTSYQAHVPCLVHGNAKAYESIVTSIMEYKVTEKDLDGRPEPHVSDMYMFYRGGIPYTSRSEVKSYGEEGWMEAKFVHFSNAATKPAGKHPRHLHIPLLRRWPKP